MTKSKLKKFNVLVFCLAIMFGAQILGSQKTGQKKNVGTEKSSDNLVIHSSKACVNARQIDHEYCVFHDAKGIISTDKGKMVLHSVKLIHYPKKYLLVGEKAKLILPDGTTKENIKKITINLKHPLDYKID
jgi:hypothetical protein